MMKYIKIPPPTAVSSQMMIPAIALLKGHFIMLPFFNSVIFFKGVAGSTCLLYRSIFYCRSAIIGGIVDSAIDSDTSAYSALIHVPSEHVFSVLL